DYYCHVYDASANVVF
nr:immunoglobulin light chain junction region [Macaca mulatta]